MSSLSSSEDGGERAGAKVIVFEFLKLLSKPILATLPSILGGCPLLGFFLAEKLLFAPYFGEKPHIFRQMIRFNDELSISVPCIKVFFMFIWL